MRAKQAMQRMYTDRAMILRHSSSKVGHETVMQKQVVHVGLPCRISQTQLPSNNQTESRNQIRYDAKLFCDPGIDIRQGDEIEVVRDGSVRAYTAGEPFLYSSHQEIGLTRKADA